MSRDCHVVSIKLIEDHEDIHQVPMTCMVLEIRDKIHKSDFSTLIVHVCGSVHVMRGKFSA